MRGGNICRVLRMSDIKQIFLDLDGPLLDGKERHYFCYQSILKRFGFEPVGVDEYWIIKRSSAGLCDVLEMSGAGAIYDDFVVAWRMIIESPEALALDRVQEGAIDCLRHWKEKGIRLTLVTMRKNKRALDEQLELTGLRQFLDAILVCDHISGGGGKADAARCALLDNVKISNAMWIGDTEIDWDAAQLLGCGIILVENGLRNREYLCTLKNSVIVPSIGFASF